MSVIIDKYFLVLSIFQIYRLIFNFRNFLVFRFARTQTEGAAYSTFHFLPLYLSVIQICVYLFVSRGLPLIPRLSICYFTTEVFLLLPTLLSLPTLLDRSIDKNSYYTKWVA